MIKLAYVALGAFAGLKLSAVGVNVPGATGDSVAACVAGLPTVSAIVGLTGRALGQRSRTDLLNAIMNAAVIDKVIPGNPCRAIRISVILRGFSRAPNGYPPPTTYFR